MTRSRWKGPFCEVSPEATMQLDSRRSTILPQWIGTTVRVHTGKHYIPLRITQDMVGHKFGEFASTRRPPRHAPKKGLAKKKPR